MNKMPCENRTVEEGKFHRKIIVRRVYCLDYVYWRAKFEDNPNRATHGYSQLEAITNLVQGMSSDVSWTVSKVEYASDYQTG